jgi:hypothetical protein
MSLLSIRSTMLIDPNDPLVKLESDLEAGLFDESYKKLMQSNKKGRPKKYSIDVNQLKELCSQALSWEDIGRKLNIDAETVRRYARFWEIHKNNIPKTKKAN